MTEQELFEQHQGIVYYCYQKLYKDEFIEQSKDDLIQEGFQALWKCCCSYDSSLDIKMSTYSFAAVRNAMFNWIKQNRWHYYNYIGFDTLIKAEDSSSLTVGETIPDKEELDNTVDQTEDILKCYKDWLKTTKIKASESFITDRLHKATILLNMILTRGKIVALHIQEEYDIDRILISQIVREIQASLKHAYPTRFEHRFGGRFDNIVND